MSPRLLPAIDISGDRVTPGCWTSRRTCGELLNAEWSIMSKVQGCSDARFSLTRHVCSFAKVSAAASTPRNASASLDFSPQTEAGPCLCP
jgi:hypothetical protein